MCFDLHPAQVETRAFRVEGIEYDGVHEGLLGILMRRLDIKLEEIDGDEYIKESYFAVR